MNKQDKSASPPARPMTRRQLSRHEREVRLRRIVFFSTVAVVALILFILGYGYYREYIGKGDEPIATVGSASIPTREFAKAVGYYDAFYFDQAMELQRIIVDNQEAAESDEAKKKLVDAASARLQQLSYQMQSLDSVALDNLVEGEILRGEAASRGYTADQAARDRALVAEFDLGLNELDAEAAATPAEPTQAEIDAARAKLNQLLDGGRVMSEEEHNRLILDPSVYRAKIKEELNAQVPTQGEQIQAAHILVDTEEAAKDALAMLKQGDLDFAATAKQLSQDPGSKEQGGDLGWFPKGVMDPAFEEAAFALEPGQTSELVQSSFGWHIIKVMDKATDRPLDPERLEQMRASAYYEWLSGLRADDKYRVEYLVDSSKIRWVQENMPKPAPTAQAPAASTAQPPASPAPESTPAPTQAPASPTPQP